MLEETPDLTANLESTAPSEVTLLLQAWNQGDLEAMNRLIQLVYQDLRRTARHYFRSEVADGTLQPTALVHEVYEQLMNHSGLVFHDRKHFFRCACLIMRQILMRQTRMRHTLKRGEGKREYEIDLESTPDFALSLPDSETLLSLDHALKQLQAMDVRKHQIVELRYFVGLTLSETALLLEVSERTIKREWRTAKLWLSRELKKRNPEASLDGIANVEA